MPPETIVPLKYTDRRLEQEIRGRCAVHGVDYGDFEAMMREFCVLVPPGGLGHVPDIGRERLFESPSERLDWAIEAGLRGVLHARRAMGHPLPATRDEEEPDALEEFVQDFKAQVERERWLREIK